MWLLENVKLQVWFTFVFLLDSVVLETNADVVYEATQPPIRSTKDAWQPALSPTLSCKCGSEREQQSVPSGRLLKQKIQLFAFSLISDI